MQEICLLVKQIWERAERHANQKLREFDMTITQSNVLTYIIGNDSPVSQKDIENYMEISHSAIVGIVSRLEEKGMVYSVQSNVDRRQKLLYVTEKGRETYSDFGEDKNSVSQKMIEGLTDAEINELFRLLKHVYNKLES